MASRKDASILKEIYNSIFARRPRRLLRGLRLLPNSISIDRRLALSFFAGYVQDRPGHKRAGEHDNQKPDNLHRKDQRQVGPAPQGDDGDRVPSPGAGGQVTG